MSNFISVFMTTASQAEAEKIAFALIDEKLAACINIFPGVQSVYRWDDKVQKEEEVVLIAKTRLEQFENLKILAKRLHSHENPCIVATPITTGHQPYLSWIIQETTK